MVVDAYVDRRFVSCIYLGGDEGKQQTPIALEMNLNGEQKKIAAAVFGCPVPRRPDTAVAVMLA